MNPEDFYTAVRACVPGANETAFIDVKCRSTSNYKTWKIYNTHVCKTCGHEDRRSVTVKFNTPQETLTIFQAGMLFSVFRLKQRPVDYACYHKCIAGRVFIENIDEVLVE